MTWQFVVTGLIIGTLVGFTGMGGGSLLTPALVLLFGFAPTTAVGTDILHGAIFKSVGALRHRRLGTVHARLSGWMFIASAPMSLVGVWTATWIARRYGAQAHSVGELVLGGALVLGAAGMAAKGCMRQPGGLRADNFVLTRRDRAAALAIGFFGGFVVGLTSVGTGVFFGLTMLIVFPLRSAKVVGTDILHGAALLWVAGIGHLVAGNVDIRAVLWLLIGSIPGVLVGSQVTAHISDSALRLSLAAVLGASGIELAAPPHANALLAGVGIIWLACVVKVAWARVSTVLASASAHPPAAPGLASPEGGRPWTDV